MTIFSIREKARKCYVCNKRINAVEKFCWIIIDDKDHDGCSHKDAVRIRMAHVKCPGEY